MKILETKPSNPSSVSYRKKGNRPGCFIVLIVLLLIVGIAVFSIKESPPQVSDYNIIELLQLPNHPKIGDNFDDTKSFYDSIGDSRIFVSDVAHVSAKQRKVKTLFSDPIVMYISEDASGYEKFSDLRINLSSSSSNFQITLDFMLEIIADYLPVDFTDFYSPDAIFKHNSDGNMTYYYSCRLNDYGVAHRSNVDPTLFPYYGFRIIQYSDGDHWMLDANCFAYAGKSVDWFNNFAEPWDVELSKYF